MPIASRTPEGAPSNCPICGRLVVVEASAPRGDAPCPHCGCLLWVAEDGGDVEVTVGAAGLLVDGPRRDELVAVLGGLCRSVEAWSCILCDDRGASIVSVGPTRWTVLDAQLMRALMREAVVRVRAAAAERGGIKQIGTVYRGRRVRLSVWPLSSAVNGSISLVVISPTVTRHPWARGVTALAAEQLRQLASTVL